MQEMQETRVPYVRRVDAPRFFVSSQQRFGVTDIKVPSAGHSSRALDKACHSSGGGGERERERQRERERDREREKERMHAWGREREREREREPFDSSFYMFFSSSWACPMQIGLRQECCST